MNSIYMCKELIFKQGKGVKDNELFNDLRNEVLKRKKTLFLIKGKYFLFGLILLLNNEQIYEQMRKKDR